MDVNTRSQQGLRVSIYHLMALLHHHRLVSGGMLSSLHGFVPVTPEAEAPRCAKAASRCFSLRCDRHNVLTWEWMGASCYLRLGTALKRPSPRRTSSPRLRRLGVRHASTFFLGGGRSSSAVLHGVSGAGAFFLLDRGVVSPAGAEGGPLEGTGYGGRRRRFWTRVGTFSRITSATAPARGTLRSRGGPPWRCASAGA
ncbi:unnamed protein product [Pleuronectes platessa]|uniref:Uncharacterized protein n=1 Tax=Pleuronectes platessa TaxID=8262 RepID=A0A9N7VTT5_PLEPL|nr:unnamed protein product [Pleuronectes platessa]